MSAIFSGVSVGAGYPVSTYANLPTPSSVPSSFLVFVSDWGANGTIARPTATRWLPVSGQTVLKRMGAAVSGIASTETIAAQVQIPINALQAGDTIRLITSLSKSGTIDALQIFVRVGTAGTTADTALTGLSAYSQINAANVSGGIIHAIRVLSTTSMVRLGTGATVAISGYGLVSTTASSAATTGLADISANAVWVTFTVKSSGATDTVGVQEVTIIHEAG